MSDDTVLKLSQPSTFSDPLTEVLRSGARSLLARAVEAEVAAFLDGHSEARTEEGRRRLVRHGHLPEREIMTGIGPVAVRAPRVRDRTGQGAERIRFSSALLPPYARRSKSLEVLIPVLYLKHLVRRIRRHWPRTRLTFRGDSHYGRTEAMAWCEDRGSLASGAATAFGNSNARRPTSGRICKISFMNPRVSAFSASVSAGSRVEEVADVESFQVLVSVELLVVGVGDGLEPRLVLRHKNGVRIAPEIRSRHGHNVRLVAGQAQP